MRGAILQKRSKISVHCTTDKNTRYLAFKHNTSLFWQCCKRKNSKHKS